VKVAAVDIGTNTVRLLLAEAVARTERWELGNIERHEVITKLGQGLEATGELSDDAIGRALAGLSYYAELITAAGVERRAAVATEATRSASNGPGFMARVGDLLGFRPRVIDGVEEATLTFAGAVTGRAPDKLRCVVDVGGGSTEFVAGREHPDYATSVDIGSVRLTERILAARMSDPAVIRGYVDSLFSGVSLPAGPGEVLGSGGTFVTLAAVHHEITKDEAEQSPGLSLTFPELTQTVDRLLGMHVSDIAELPGVVLGRAGVLRAGAVCAERAVAAVGGTEIEISVADILDGIALQLAAGDPQT
jgi:exopolyphosphatase/guanosine-5'-triphosphate,3'-diphosphate pyrophosphatase